MLKAQEVVGCQEYLPNLKRNQRTMQPNTFFPKICNWSLKVLTSQPATSGVVVPHCNYSYPLETRSLQDCWQWGSPENNLKITMSRNTVKMTCIPWLKGSSFVTKQLDHSSCARMWTGNSSFHCLMGHNLAMFKTGYCFALLKYMFWTSTSNTSP